MSALRGRVAATSAAPSTNKPSPASALRGASPGPVLAKFEPPPDDDELLDDELLDDDEEVLEVLKFIT